eukprot:1073520-Alexandrium_andersonii.AAC.1
MARRWGQSDEAAIQSVASAAGCSREEVLQNLREEVGMQLEECGNGETARQLYERFLRPWEEL